MVKHRAEKVLLSVGKTESVEMKKSRVNEIDNNSLTFSIRGCNPSNESVAKRVKSVSEKTENLRENQQI